MVLSKQVGTILREAREAKKYSVRDVARETNMIPRYIEALESEDYSVFPGETYALGFLRSYSDFLHLDTAHLLDLYRGLQIDQSQAPVKELTKPTGGVMPHLDRNLILAAAGGAVVILLIALFAGGVIELPSWENSVPEVGVVTCEGRTVEKLTVPVVGEKPKIVGLSGENTVKFSFNELNLKLCLSGVEKSPDNRRMGVFILQSDENVVHRFRAGEQQTEKINSQISGLGNLKPTINITPRILGDVSAKVQIDHTGAPIAEVPEEVIRVVLEFVDKSYVEWESDGNPVQAETIDAGTNRILEAQDRLLIKIGNGGGVKVGRGGNRAIAGPAGKIVRFVFKRVPDPLDNSKFRIEESKEVVR